MRSPSLPLFPLHRKPILIALAFVTVLAVSTLWLARTTLLEWLVEGVLTSRDLGPAHVEVLELGATHAALALHGSALGTIERFDVDYRLKLATGIRAERVRIAGARLQLAWRDGKLSPSLGTSEASAPLPELAIELVDTHIALRIGASLIKAKISGELHSGAVEGQAHSAGALTGRLAFDDGQLASSTFAAQGIVGELHLRGIKQGLPALDGQLAIAQLSSAQQAFGAATVTLTQASSSALLLSLHSTPLRLSLRAEQAAASSTRHFSLDADLDARTLATAWPAIDIGAGKLQLQATAERPATITSLQDWLVAGQSQATLTLTASTLALPEIATVDTLTASLNCALSAGALSCTSAQGLQADGVQLAKRLAANESLLAGRSALRLAARDAGPLLSLDRDDHGRVLSVNSEVSLLTPQLLLRAPLAVRVSLDVASAEPALLTGRVTVDGSITAERPVGQAWLAPQFTLHAQYKADTLSHTLKSVTLTDGKLTLPAQGWAANALKGSYTSAAEDSFKLSIGELRSTREPAPLVPLKAELNARVSDAQASFKGSVQDAIGHIRAEFSGQHQRRSGVGEAHFALQPIVLTGQNSLRALTPALATRITSASGELAANGATQWGAGAPRSQLSLALRDIALRGPALKVAKLNAQLALDSLAPLHSANGQILSVELELPALKLVPLALRFQIADQRLQIEHARAQLFDGAFETSDASIDIVNGATRIDLRVIEVDLASAFTVLNLDTLKGSGRLSGRLPLRFEGGHIAVEQGLLEASGPGVVQIGASALTEQLKSYGRDVDLAFRALSDFHYQSLRITAEKSLLGAGKALLHLEGDSPTVLAGQPFIFNISLETDFDYLAKLLLELSGITNSALGWGAGELFKQ